jgi:predicted metalloendopeptidase
MVEQLKSQQVKNADEARISAIWEASAARFADWAEGKGDTQPIVDEFLRLDSILKPSKKPSDVAEYIERVAECLHYTQFNGITNVFDFDKTSDFDNSNNVILDFKACGLSLPGREYYVSSAMHVL